MKKIFQLDKRNGKMMGVCSGIANYTGIDATFVRIGAIVVTLLGAFPWTVVAYLAAAWLSKSKPASSYDPVSSYGDAAAPRLSASTYEVRQSMRDIDRCMAEVETFVTSQNSRLAREIEELR
nr:PspC domain-containing protein [uncultured Sphingosinicella sp.]